MKGSGAKISGKQEKAIVALMSNPTVQAAAQACGTSETTLWRWTRDADFRSALIEARTEAFDTAVGLLQKASGGAVVTLINLMRSEDTPAAQRITACRSILEFAMKGADVLALHERVAALEERMQQEQEKLGEGASQ